MIDDPKNSESFIVFPIEGLHTFAAATYTFDFITGKVNIPGAADLSLSGRLDQDEVLRSVLFYCTDVLNVELLLNDDLQFKGPIISPYRLLLEMDHKAFNLMRVTPTTALPEWGTPVPPTVYGTIYVSTHERAFGKNAIGSIT